MAPNYLNRFGVMGETCTDRPILAETELWTAVILQAIDDLNRRTRLSPRSAQSSARQWFASEDDAVGGFIWTCHVIDVDPNFIRSRLAKRQRMQNPVELVMTSRTQRVKMPREKGFAILQEPVDHAQPSQIFKRVVVGL